ncbi:hypothetical protein BZG36_03697 [Bifiguratus adelaidae]|uniref:Glycosyltransferase 2-like domain-containing protein n=1 Tax=Bifiguratus adelaidae TaxID=1938954 RepID=A0A261XZ31_9FUNG|nr:hypothetical protein BZG36_03697 [Bifiguratus adelaidae]
MANALLWPVRIFYSIVVSIILVVPAVVGYVLNIHVTNVTEYWALGMYGATVLSYLALQMCFATCNRLLTLHMRRKDLKSKVNTLGEPTRLGMAVVGYREDPMIFSKCLQSVKKIQYPSPIQIVVVIDGNDIPDREMANVFRKEYLDAPVVTLPNLPSVTTLAVDNQFFFDICQKAEPISCILQPHRGKRHAMYTAFRFLMSNGCQAVITTDSDTVFDSQAVTELERAMHWYPNIGAVAGDVRIWNTSNVLSFMSSLRYWMAFNVERAAQSFNRCVTCVSGPMGLYKSQILEEVLDSWISQRFLGSECTYGDDRHLTNQVLLKGYKVVYTHLAYCETETPTHYIRWFKQQTRWSKSFYRELLWNVLSIHKHSPWMAAELFYQGLYPFILLYSMYFILVRSSTEALATWVVSLFVIALIKTSYSFLVTLNPKFFTFPLYSVFYISGLIPAKIWAIISIWDIGWGTTARTSSELKHENELWTKIKEALPLLLWWSLVLAGILWNILSHFAQPNPNTDPYSLQFQYTS